MARRWRSTAWKRTQPRFRGEALIHQETRTAEPDLDERVVAEVTAWAGTRRWDDREISL